MLACGTHQLQGNSKYTDGPMQQAIRLKYRTLAGLMVQWPDGLMGHSLVRVYTQAFQGAPSPWKYEARWASALLVQLSNCQIGFSCGAFAVVICIACSCRGSFHEKSNHLHAPSCLCTAVHTPTFCSSCMALPSLHPFGNVLYTCLCAFRTCTVVC